jgi:DNA-binding NarL/FixJ family response regulator
MSRPPVSVFIVEDQPKILKSQLKLLKQSPELDIVGTALSGEAAYEEVVKLLPDVVLLDLGLPRMSGIELTLALKKAAPKLEILVFTIFDEEDKVLEAIRAGASGYLLKGAPSEKIIEAILEVHSGGTVIQPSLARRLLRHFPPADTKPQAPAAQPAAHPLSQREREILQLIAKGISNSEAAELLKISQATIRTHLEHIYRKLEVTNRVEAVTEGLRKGIISI